MTLAYPPDDWGAPAAPERQLGADDRVSARWASALERANKGKVGAAALSIRTPLGTLGEVMERRTLPPMPWPAGWHELARRCRTNPGDLTTLVGGTGSGKTQFAIELARAFAAAGKGCVVWAPLEIEPPDLSIRIVANLTHTHAMEIRDHWAQAQIANALATVTDRWIYVDVPRDAPLEAQLLAIDTAVGMATQIYSAPCQLVVDYVQLMADTEDQRAAVTASMRGLERTTVRHRCYSIVLSQTSRANQPALAGRVAVESATDLVGAAAETSLVERSSANVVVMNVFKADDVPSLDAHLNASKCRNTGLEGKIGARYHKAGGWWEELDHLPATPLEVDAEVKKAKRAGTPEAPSEARDVLNAGRSSAAADKRREAIVAALRAAGSGGTTARDLRRVRGAGSPARLRETLDELAKNGRAVAREGRWVLIQ